VQNISTFVPFELDSLIESDGLRNGPLYKDATIFYPTSTNSLKSIVFVPGYLASQSSVIIWARYLASRGFLCMTIGTNSLSDNPSTRAKALIDGMETIRQENDRITSTLYKKIDTGHIAVAGWSMGGGGAQLAAKIDPRIKAVLAITPWLGNDVILAKDLNHSVPVLIISGKVDPIAPPASHSNLHYNNTPVATPKLLFEIESGNHNTPLNPSTGKGDNGNLAFAWLKLFLDNNNCYCSMLSLDSLDQNSTSSKYLTNLSCSTVSIEIKANQNLGVQIFPNPVADEFTVTFSKHNEVQYAMFDVFGKQVKSGKVRSGEIINISELTNGMYSLKIEYQTLKVQINKS
jgi:pimeloyl-ACP methyl ester carboxylesterase